MLWVMLAALFFLGVAILEKQAQIYLKLEQIQWIIENGADNE